MRSEVEVNKARTDDGTTPLYTAAQNGHTECVRLLLADPRVRVNQPGVDDDTPLVISANSDENDILRL